MDIRRGFHFSRLHLTAVSRLSPGLTALRSTLRAILFLFQHSDLLRKAGAIIRHFPL